MNKEAREDRLLATAEDLLGYSRPLDLYERATLKEIRMDRAERIVRDKAKTRNFSEVQIERRIGIRRWFRGMPLMLVKAAAGVGIGIAADELKDRATKAIKRL